MKKPLKILFCLIALTSCKKDKTSIAEAIPAHAPRNFELLTTVPASPFSLGFLRVGPNGQFIWSASEIWRSSDLGETWYQVNSPGGSWSAAIVSTNTFFAGSHNLYRTADNGINYTEVLSGSTSGNTYDVEYLGGNTILAACDRIKKSTDLGETWTDVYNQELDSATVQEMQFMNSNCGYVMTTPDINSFLDVLLLKTGNGGNSWEPSLIVPNSICADFHFASSKVGYALIVNTDNVITLYKTTNGGQHWITIPFTGIFPHKIHFYNETEGYVAANGHLYLTKDGGYNWEQLAITWDNLEDPLISMVHYKGKVFLAFSSGKLYRSAM